MVDIIVTTPKSQMQAAAREADDVKRAGGGYYFRRFSAPIRNLGPGSRVYYVEDGYVRGYAKVVHTDYFAHGRVCATTGRWWEPGFYITMDATTWAWVNPYPMVGFQGWRLALPVIQNLPVIGDWLDTKPPVAEQS